jgi:hypothetical protein
MPKIPSLTILLPTILIAWLVGCVAVHGPAIFAYLAMHAVTTGVFATLVWRAERAMQKSSSVNVATTTPSRPVAKPERVPARADKQAAVA